MGPGRFDEDGDKRVPLDISVGDVVIYSKYGGTEVKYNNEDYLILCARRPRDCGEMQVRFAVVSSAHQHVVTPDPARGWGSRFCPGRQLHRNTPLRSNCPLAPSFTRHSTHEARKNMAKILEFDEDARRSLERGVDAALTPFA